MSDKTVLPTLQPELLRLISRYGCARYDGENEVEIQHRWLLLIDGIKDYARAVLAAATPGQVEADAEFEILQDDHPVASSFGPRARAAREALHYAAQYAQDGELTIVEVTRKAITIDALKSASVSEQKGNV
jgi:hypothetical protein